MSISKKLYYLLVSAFCLVGMALPSNASVLATVGGEIIAAPSDITDDAATNTIIQAFDEKQGVLLGADLQFDAGMLGNGMRVDSHMIFLNTDGNTAASYGLNGANPISFTFSGDILGVMSDYRGSLELASNGTLGAMGTLYPVSTQSARGLEGDPLDGLFNNDWYSVSGDTISLGFQVTEPGDWIRVVTVSAVPLPASALLLISAFGAMFGLRRRKTA